LDPWKTLLLIARSAFTEALRPSFHAVLLLTGIGLIAVSPVLSSFALGDENRLLVDISLSSMLAAGLFLGAFTAASSLGDEIRRRTVMVLLSKPVHRWVLLSGKFLGIAAALTLVQCSWVATLLLAIRHRTIHSRFIADEVPVLFLGGLALIAALLFSTWQHRRGRSFPASLSPSCALLINLAAWVSLGLSPEGEWVSPFQQINANTLAAMLLVHLAVLVLASIALAASTRIPTPATLAVTVGTLLTGILAGSWGRGETWSRFIPDLQRLWISDGLIRGGEVSSGSLAWAIVWALLTILGMLGLGIALFERRDVG
jgi:ABC-type transport system involved in multi-copper enzyme maturation permease subunit